MARDAGKAACTQWLVASLNLEGDGKSLLLPVLPPTLAATAYARHAALCAECRLTGHRARVHTRRDTRRTGLDGICHARLAALLRRSRCVAGYWAVWEAWHIIPLILMGGEADIIIWGGAYSIGCRIVTEGLFQHSRRQQYECKDSSPYFNGGKRIEANTLRSHCQGGKTGRRACQRLRMPLQNHRPSPEKAQR